MTNKVLSGIRQIEGGANRLVDIGAGGSTLYTGDNILIAVYVGDVSAGATVKVTDEAGTALTFQNVPVGTTLTGRFQRIWNTGSLAAGFIGYQR